MHVWYKGGLAKVRCQTMAEVDEAKAAHPDWLRVTGWLGEVIEVA